MFKNKLFTGHNSPSDKKNIEEMKKNVIEYGLKMYKPQLKQELGDNLKNVSPDVLFSTIQEIYSKLHPHNNNKDILNRFYMSQFNISHVSKTRKSRNPNNNSNNSNNNNSNNNHSRKSRKTRKTRKTHHTIQNISVSKRKVKEDKYMKHIELFKKLMRNKYNYLYGRVFDINGLYGDELKKIQMKNIKDYDYNKDKWCIEYLTYNTTYHPDEDGWNDNIKKYNSMYIPQKKCFTLFDIIKYYLTEEFVENEIKIFKQFSEDKLKRKLDYFIWDHGQKIGIYNRSNWSKDIEKELYAIEEALKAEKIRHDYAKKDITTLYNV